MVGEILIGVVLGLLSVATFFRNPRCCWQCCCGPSFYREEHRYEAGEVDETMNLIDVASAETKKSRSNQNTEESSSSVRTNHQPNEQKREKWKKEEKEQEGEEGKTKGKRNEGRKNEILSKQCDACDGLCLEYCQCLGLPKGTRYNPRTAPSIICLGGSSPPSFTSPSTTSIKSTKGGPSFSTLSNTLINEAPSTLLSTFYPPPRSSSTVERARRQKSRCTLCTGTGVVHCSVCHGNGWYRPDC